MTDLTILQLNLWLGGTKVPNGLDRVADVVRANGAELVITTESSPGAVQALRDKLGAGWHTATDSAGSGILAKWPMNVTSRSAYHVAADVSHPAKKISVYSIHLEYRYYTPFLYRGYGGESPGHSTGRYGWGKLPSPLVNEEDLVQVQEMSRRPQVAAELVAKMKADRAKGNLVVSGGDFNEPSHLDYTKDTMYEMGHLGVTHVWESTKTFESAGFVDAFRQAYPNPLTHPGVTWPVAVDGHDLGSISYAPEADPRDRIDFVHYDISQARLRSAQIVGPPQSIAYSQRITEKDAASFVRPTAAWPSDHRGNLVKLRY